MRSVASDIFYVYVDYRLDTNVPFYVGKGQDVRVKLVRRNIIHQRIAKKAGMRREVLFGTKDQHFALDEEVRLIRELKTRNQFGGANLTDGGEGTTGWVPSEETKRKIAIAHQGLAHTSETKARISQATSGENNPNYGNRVDRPTTKCSECDTVFHERLSRGKKCCSRECRFKRLARLRLGEANPNHVERIERPCMICGLTMKLLPSDNERRCCSPECRKKLRSENVKRQWKHGNIGKPSQK